MLAAGLLATGLATLGWPLTAADAAILSANGDSQEITQLLGNSGDVPVAGETVNGDLLRAFYAGRQGRLAWGASAPDILAILAAAKDEGLSTAPFHLAAIKSGLDQPDQTNADLLLTDAILRYASAMRGVRVNPQRIESDWFLPKPSFDPVQFLNAHIDDMPAALAGLEPQQDEYQSLKTALARLHAVTTSGDWPKVTADGPPLHPGDSNPRILAVRLRLQATGELAADAPALPDYDDALLQAVKLFQTRNGLTPDGALGPRTLAALNMSAAQRANQVALNMERWRWLPDHFEPQHIIVNVPAQSMEMVADGKPAISMRVVVGDVNHPTPAMHLTMTSMVFNPEWRVPASIATAEILPKLKQNAGYLVANDLELISNDFPPGSPESQGAGIDWSKLNAMPWAVRQLPGADNALGRIKFNMPNDDDIYLHDSPERNLFARAARAFSHGCVRLENAAALALTLLQGKGWDQSRLDQEIGTGETHSVALSHPLPVWLLYFTAWIDPDGTIEYRDDLYGRDRRLAQALAHPDAPPPERGFADTVKYCAGCRMP